MVHGVASVQFDGHPSALSGFDSRRHSIRSAPLMVSSTRLDSFRPSPSASGEVQQIMYLLDEFIL